PACLWFGVRPDAIDKMLILNSERLIGPDVRSNHVAISICRRTFMRWRPVDIAFQSAVVDPQALLGEIVVDRHFLAADHRYRPRLPWIKPGEMGVAGNLGFRVLEADVRKIVNITKRESVTPRDYRTRLRVEQIIQDGDIVRREIPNHVHVRSI